MKAKNVGQGCMGYMGYMASPQTTQSISDIRWERKLYKMQFQQTWSIGACWASPFPVGAVGDSSSMVPVVAAAATACAATWSKSHYLALIELNFETLEDAVSAPADATKQTPPASSLPAFALLALFCAAAAAFFLWWWWWWCFFLFLMIILRRSVDGAGSSTFGSNGWDSSDLSNNISPNISRQ